MNNMQWAIKEIAFCEKKAENTESTEMRMYYLGQIAVLHRILLSLKKSAVEKGE